MILLFTGSAFGQGFPGYSGGLKVNLDVAGDRYFRLITWHQVWARYNQNNDGSMRAGTAQDATTDFGLRRSRFLMFSQINKKFLIVTHFGINNQNAVSGHGLPSLPVMGAHALPGVLPY